MKKNTPSHLPVFLWGTATSSHQVEGNNFHNDWWAWESEGRLPFHSELACDHYRRYEEDFDLISRLGQNAHRFSVEWSRIEPEENVWNDEALDHYRKVVDALLVRKIEPVVTLHHFTNPLWFSASGGWLRPDAIKLFTRFVEKITVACGGHVRYWVTINEPMIYLYFGYFAGLWPPGQHTARDSMRAFRQLVHAHIAAYAKIHELYGHIFKRPVAVSLAQHVTCFSPCRSHAIQDRVAVLLRNWFANRLFLNAVNSGFLFFPGVFCEKLPFHRTLDFLAVNYYSRYFIRFKNFSLMGILGDMCEATHHDSQRGVKNTMGWEIYPEGLYQILKDLHRYRLPIMITENGICTRDDKQREQYIIDHVEAVRRAKQDGVDVMGYLYWSLFDNFEWAHGFEPHFGIVGITEPNRARIIKSSAYVLTEICRKIIHGGC